MKKRVFLDGIHTAVISINDADKTVIAELEKDNKSELIYAEKFDEPCYYEKEAVKACIKYLKNSFCKTEIKNAFVGIVALFAVFLNFKLP